MGCSNTDDVNQNQKSFRIKHDDDRFFKRLMSKESSKSNSSFRVLYYGNVSIAVPFTWETRPGTPKNSYDPTRTVPLTPPPSYNYTTKSKKKYSSRSKLLLHNLFRRMNPRKSHLPSSSLSWSSSSDDSISSHRSCFDGGLCLSVGINAKENRKRLQSALILKKVFFSIVGRGSN